MSKQTVCSLQRIKFSKAFFEKGQKNSLTLIFMSVGDGGNQEC